MSSPDIQTLCWTGQFTVNQDLCPNTPRTQNHTHAAGLLACQHVNSGTLSGFSPTELQCSRTFLLLFLLRVKVSTEVFTTASSARLDITATLPESFLQQRCKYYDILKAREMSRAARVRSAASLRNMWSWAGIRLTAGMTALLTQWHTTVMISMSHRHTHTHTPTSLPAPSCLIQLGCLLKRENDV